MDRWSEDTSTATAHVPNFSRGQASQFVRSQGPPASHQGAAQPAAVIIQPSRRQQVQEAARNTAARLAAQGGAPPAATAAASGSKVPSWAQEPPPGYSLEVVKDGQVVQEVALSKPGTVLGRSPTADLVLDHASISRTHAALCYHPASGCMVLLDLGSVHGTWADGQPVRSGEPAQLQPGSELRLGASSRRYFLRRRTSGASAAAEPAQQAQQQPSGTGAGPGSSGQKREGVDEEGWQGAGAGSRETGEHEVKRARVRFADQGEGGGPVEEVIGYTQRGSSFHLVGPRPVKDEAEGRFAKLVRSTMVPEGPKADQEQPPPQQPVEQRPGGEGSAEEGMAGRLTPAVARPLGSGRAGIGHAASAGKGARSAMELFNRQLQQGRQQQQQGDAGGRSNLFAGLPPPSNAGSS